MMAGGWIGIQSDKYILAWMDKDYGLMHCPQCRPTSAAEFKSALSAG